MVMLGVDTANGQLDIRSDTLAESGDVIFDFAMVRIDDESEEIFELLESGLNLRNSETLIIDYSSWKGGNSVPRVGYDANANGILDPKEESPWEDSGGK